MIELICPELFRILESELHGRRGCCLGCQLSDYSSGLSNDSVYIQTNENEAEANDSDTFEGAIVLLKEAKYPSYSPINRNLAEAILSAENAYRYWRLFDEFNVEGVKVQFL